MAPFDYRILNSIPQKRGRGNDWLVQNWSAQVKGLDLEFVISDLSPLFLCFATSLCSLIAYALAINFFAWLCLLHIDLKNLYQIPQLSAW